MSGPRVSRYRAFAGKRSPLPPSAREVAPQGRMRGELAAAARVRGISASPPLISQRAGPLTASPKGEAFLFYTYIS